MEQNAYRRVSTARQGASGLGLEAQDVAVAAYAMGSGGMIPRTDTEIETGKRADRLELAKALTDAKRSRGRLVIAKLDRLARNARFLRALIESVVDAAFCDLPTVPPGAVGKFLLTQMAAVAEREAGLISERTKAALAAYKARGGVLNAARPGAYADLALLPADMRAGGRSLRKIAGRLNADDHITRRGKAWNQVHVKRMLII